MFLLFDDCPDLGLSGVSTIAPEESHLVNTVGRRGRGRGGVLQVGGVEWSVLLMVSRHPDFFFLNTSSAPISPRVF